MTREQALMLTASVLLATGGWGACGSDQEFEVAAQKAMARAIRLGEYAKFSEGIHAARFERAVKEELESRGESIEPATAQAGGAL